MAASDKIELLYEYFELRYSDSYPNFSSISFGSSNCSTEPGDKTIRNEHHNHKVWKQVQLFRIHECLRKPVSFLAIWRMPIREHGASLTETRRSRMQQTTIQNAHSLLSIQVPHSMKISGFNLRL